MRPAFDTPLAGCSVEPGKQARVRLDRDLLRFSGRKFDAFKAEQPLARLAQPERLAGFELSCLKTI